LTLEEVSGVTAFLIKIVRSVRLFV